MGHLFEVYKYRALPHGGVRLAGFLLALAALAVAMGLVAHRTGSAEAVAASSVGLCLVLFMLHQILLPEAQFVQWVRLWRDLNVHGYSLWMYVDQGGALYQKILPADATILPPAHNTAVLRIPLGGWGNSTRAFWATGGATTSIYGIFAVRLYDIGPPPHIWIQDAEGSKVLMSVADALAFIGLYMVKLGASAGGMHRRSLRWSEVAPTLIQYAIAAEPPIDAAAPA